MNRINQLFQQKKSNILSVYFTAGYPHLGDTTRILKALDSAGADIIEIGMPFSDPMADGPVIQKSNDIALKNGMSLKLLFDQIKDIRKETNIPLIMMGYINPVMYYGIEAFCKKCHETGIDGIILPDLPFEIYVTEYKSVFEKYNLHKIFLISPQTSEERIRSIDEISNGFLYLVSASSTTGARDKFSKDQEEYFDRFNRMNLKNPRLVGFGISNNQTYTQVCKYTSGAIIGSAFIKSISESAELEKGINDFVELIKNPKN